MLELVLVGVIGLLFQQCSQDKMADGNQFLKIRLQNQICDTFCILFENLVGQNVILDYDSLVCPKVLWD